jgi:hypothetical protein
MSLKKIFFNQFSLILFIYLFVSTLPTDGAAEEKNRLEEKQRGVRKDRKKSKDEWTPV